MDGRRFWEDENELPYLVSEDRDDHYSSRAKSNRKKPEKSEDEQLDDIVNSLYISGHQRALLKGKLKSFLNARGCTALRVEDGFDGYSFIFTRQNEYVKTTDEFIYVARMSNDRRVFQECYTNHNYDGLLSNPRFKRMIEVSGMEFNRCGGGFVTDYSMAKDEFTMADELDLRVIFNVDGGISAYELDLDRMELGEKLF